jgi:AcrR family transcriptional regulator
MPDEETPVRQTRAPGERSRARVVEQAAPLATIEGIDGLSIGRLADATGIAKSSVYALFGSKEELQLATIGAARDSFVTEVVAPAFGATKPGRERLHALCEGFLSYVERRVFPGGCFFVSASAEVGGRPGRVHDEVARIQQQWGELLGREAVAAVDNGELAAGTDPQQVAFELGVILAGTNIVSVLHDDFAVIDRGRSAIRKLLSNDGRSPQADPPWSPGILGRQKDKIDAERRTTHPESFPR